MAAEAAASEFALGSAGAGMGATSVNLKGGIGSASRFSPRFTATCRRMSDMPAASLRSFDLSSLSLPPRRPMHN